MWSYVQRRQIAKDVQLNHRKGDASQVERATVTHLGRSDRDNTSSPSPEERAGSEKQEDDAGEKHDGDAIIVRGSGDDDPLDPLNWPLASRIKATAIVASLVFTQAWAGAAESVGNAMASKELHVSPVTENLTTAMYLFGIGSGALFAGPLSESVGRNPTYLVATFCYLCFVLGSAMTPTIGGQIVCRYFVGLFASATLTINGSSITDQFRPVKRAYVFPLIAWANVTAPVIAPIAGGWIVANPALGWRWTEWVTLIISGAAFLIALLFLPETFYPLLLEWKARELRRSTGDNRYVSDHAQSASLGERLKKTLPLPATYFRTEPVVAVLGLYLVLLYILLFTFLSGFDYLFKKTYSLSSGIQGSCFASIALGTTAFALGAPLFYAWARWKTDGVRGANIQPEFRLWPSIVAAPLLPIALFWLGWTNYPSVSMWSSLAACFVFGLVLAAIYTSSYEYITDSYQEHSAIALASITMVRYLIAGGMVMAARPMYEGIGVHFTMTLLGCVAVVLTPAPLLFYKYGPVLREKSPYAATNIAVSDK